MYVKTAKPNIKISGTKSDIPTFVLDDDDRL